MLGEISNYRSTYPNKDQATSSGAFYNEFVVAFSEVIESVQSQVELTPRMLFDSLVIDKRTSLLGSEGWKAPVRYYSARGTFESPSNNYIPENWFHITRKSFIRDFGTLADRKKIYGDSDEDFAVAQAIDQMGSSGIEVGADFGALYVGFYNTYREMGFDEADSAELARAETNYQLSTGDTGIATDLLVLSQLVSLEKLQKYFRINVPYNAFNFKQASLRRRELDVLDHDNGENYVVPIIRTHFRTPTNDVTTLDSSPTIIDHPRAEKSTLEFDRYGGTRAADADINQRFKYCRPAVFIGEAYRATFMKPINFDFMTHNRANRLDGFNDLDVVSSWDEYGSARVMDGYRLQAFYFDDYMDDDVAFFNTSAGGSSTRLEHVAGLNVRSAVKGTHYRARIIINDHTSNVYCDFVNYVIEVYNNYLSYVGEAREICSFNNLNNSYNQFFIDAINDKYPDKPWTVAAWVAVGLSDILFGSPRAISEETYRERVLTELLKISPETGNLEQTIQFARVFNTMLQYIATDVEAADDAETVIGTSTPGTTMDSIGSESKEISFTNEIPIPSQIYGDVAPDYSDQYNPNDVREVAPFPIIAEEWTTSAYGTCIYNGGLGVPILAGMSDSEKVKYIWERLFMLPPTGPTYFALHPRVAGVDLAASDGSSSRIFTFVENSFETYMGRGTESDRVSGDHTFTQFTYIIDRMLRYFSTDVKLSADGTHGIRRGSNSSIAKMRDFRTLHQIAYILETYMIPECTRRKNHYTRNSHKDVVDWQNYDNFDNVVTDADHNWYYQTGQLGFDLPHLTFLWCTEALEYVTKFIDPHEFTASDVGLTTDYVDAIGGTTSAPITFGGFIGGSGSDALKLFEIVRSEDPEGTGRDLFVTR